MRQVIGGKLYNTETAMEICDVPCSNYPGDFEYHETKLYKSPRGKYLVAGHGGPKSRWSRTVGNNSWSGGRGIEIVDNEEAREIMESAELSPEEMRAAGVTVEEG